MLVRGRLGGRFACGILNGLSGKDLADVVAADTNPHHPLRPT
jgi:hypothetical protein